MAMDKQSLTNLKGISFKKSLMGAAVLGLVAVPSIVAAESGGSTVALNTASATSGVSGSSSSSSPLSRGSSANHTDASVYEAAESGNGNASATTAADVTGTVQTPSGATIPTDDSTTLNPGITFGQAVADAQAVYSNKTIVRAGLYPDGSSTVFKVAFSDGSMVEINGTDGTVLSSFDATATNTGTTASSDTDTDGGGQKGRSPLKSAWNRLNHWKNDVKAGIRVSGDVLSGDKD